MMRALFLRLVMVFSVLLAGMHMPVSAHAVDLGGHHDSHMAASHGTAGGDHEMPVDSDCDFLQHHHCPLGLANHASPDLASMLIEDMAPAAVNTVAPHSRATAPPLKPPSA
jgi:hypothetical protein